MQRVPGGGFRTPFGVDQWLYVYGKIYQNEAEIAWMAFKDFPEQMYRSLRKFDPGVVVLIQDALSGAMSEWSWRTVGR